MEVIGFEGSFRADWSTPLTWGAAAVRDGEMVYNSCSGFGSKDRWEEYVKDGSVTAFKTPIPVTGDKWKNCGALILAVNEWWEEPMRHDNATAFEWQTRPVPSFGGGMKYCAYLYENHEAFTKDFQIYKKGILKRFDGLLRTGLILSAHSLELNAVYTTLKLLDENDDRSVDRIKSSGQNILRSTTDEQKFETIFYGKKED